MGTSPPLPGTGEMLAGSLMGRGFPPFPLLSWVEDEEGAWLGESPISQITAVSIRLGCML